MKPFGYIFRALGIWVLIIFVESIHGTIRQIVLVPLIGDFTARQVSVFTGAALIFLITLVSIRWIGPPDKMALFVIGMIWIVLTVCFEVGLGFYVFGFPKERLLEDYNLLRGGLMGIGLLLMFLSPFAAHRIRANGKGNFQRINSGAKQ